MFDSSIPIRFTDHEHTYCKYFSQETRKLKIVQTAVDKRSRFAKYSIATIFTMQRICIARTMPWEDVCPFVCLSVCPSGIACKRLDISSKFFRHRAAPPF